MITRTRKPNRGETTMTHILISFLMWVMPYTHPCRYAMRREGWESTTY